MTLRPVLGAIVSAGTEGRKQRVLVYLHDKKQPLDLAQPSPGAVYYSSE